MARKACRAVATTEQMLTSLRIQCVGCGQPMWVAYHTQRTITTLQGNCCLTLCVRSIIVPIDQKKRADGRYRTVSSA